MSDGLHHHDEDTADDEWTEDSGPPFLSAPVSAISAFTLAVVALLGQNAMSVGVSTLLESSVRPGPDAFYVGWGVATAIQVAIALVLARRTFDVGGWEANVGRAAVLVSLVALAAGALVVAGGLLDDGPPLF